MQSIHVALEEHEDGQQTTDAVDAVDKDNGSSRVPLEQKVQEDILRNMSTPYEYTSLGYLVFQKAVDSTLGQRSSNHLGRGHVHNGGLHLLQEFDLGHEGLERGSSVLLMLLLLVAAVLILLLGHERGREHKCLAQLGLDWGHVGCIVQLCLIIHKLFHVVTPFIDAPTRMKSIHVARTHMLTRSFSGRTECDRGLQSVHFQSCDRLHQGPKTTGCCPSFADRIPSRMAITRRVNDNEGTSEYSSQKRPGVATIISGHRSNNRCCFSVDIPPTTAIIYVRSKNEI